jgi:hypothetical protein
VSHDDGLEELSTALTAAGFANELYHDCIHISLLGGAAMVEVKSWAGGERSVQLFRGSECRNLVATPGEFECSPQDAVARLREKLAACGVDVLAADIGARET